MIFLIGSILFSSFLTIAFKICERLGIDTFQAIVFNYLTCVITGCLFDKVPDPVSMVKSGWLPWAILMGLFFITFFNVTALTVRNNGVAVASVANKLSLVIPFTFSIILYNESTGIIKIAGIFVAVAAVILTCYKGRRQDETFSNRSYILPAILFLGSGFLDAIIKYTEQRFVSDSNRDNYIIMCFFFAFTAGAIIYITALLTKRIKFDVRAIFGGICIGVPNYFSIWCLIAVLQEYKSNSSAIIPINNMGIVLLSSIVAWLLFREKLSWINGVGIALAIVSILMITSAI